MLRFFWRVLMMQHTKKNIDVFIFSLITNMYYKIIAWITHEMIGILIVLIMLIVIIAVLIIHANNKNST